MKVAIIGGGACGLLLANRLEEKHISYELFERGLIGRKILASGNGKANIGNTLLDADKYNHPLAYQLVKEYQNELSLFWKKMGLYTKTDVEGRIYPYSESSLSVLNSLVKENMNIIENYPITSISKLNHKYYLNDVRGPFDYIVLATGSIASFIPKKQKGFYDYFASLNLEMKSIRPSLVGFKLECDLKRYSGIRMKCQAKLYQNKTMIHQEYGEIILKSDGISGICIMNLSSYYARLIDQKNCFISLDLIPDLEVKLTSKKDLLGLIHPKFYDYFKEKSLNEIEALLHNLSFPIKDVYDYEFAQVVSGGISLNEIEDNLSLRKDSHIFVGGELLDIDGVCGGYNLMFAFCCALKIGDELCNIK